MKCPHGWPRTHCLQCRAEEAEATERARLALVAKLADREARLKAVRAHARTGEGECWCSDRTCGWCRAYRAADLRVRNWREP